MKTLKYSIMCVYMMSFLFAASANATMSPTGNCNVTVEIDNSNCNDNNLCDPGSSGGSHHGKSCGCKKKKSCGTIFEANFKSTFLFAAIEEQSGIKITPYIIQPTCEIIYGTPVEFTCAGQVECEDVQIAVNQCLRVCFACDGTFSVGYIVEIDEPISLAQQILFQVANNDSVCACGKRIPMPDFYTSLLGGDFGFQLVSRTNFVFGCCENICDCDCCDLGCNGDCSLPFVDTFSGGPSGFSIQHQRN